MRFTDDERKTLELAAGDRPLAAFIRWFIFKEDIPEMPKKRTRGETADIDQKAIAKLIEALGQSRISANINQLAKAANSGSLPVNHDVVESPSINPNTVQIPAVIRSQTCHINSDFFAHCFSP